MSAAEKLKALDGAFPWYEGETASGEKYRLVPAHLADALPQIVAVVEQLERVLAPWEKVRGQEGPISTATNEALSPAWDALSALEEALS